MELKNECIRDVLLTAEDMDLNEKLINESVFKSSRLQKYSKKDVVYTIKKLKEAELLQAAVEIYPTDGYRIKIGELTPQGHTFIKDIKEDTVWERAKERAKKLGTSISLVALKTLASEEASKFYN